jgi:methyltransferase-like protein
MQPGGYVTNLLHEQVKLDVLNSHLLANLDGTRDRAALLEVLVDLVSNGTIVATQNGEAIEELETVRTVMADQLEARLQELARMALLFR